MSDLDDRLAWRDLGVFMSETSIRYVFVKVSGLFALIVETTVSETWLVVKVEGPSINAERMLKYFNARPHEVSEAKRNEMLKRGLKWIRLAAQ